MTHDFNGNNDDDGNDDYLDDEFSPMKPEFLKETFEPGAYAVLNVLVKLDQLEKFINLMYDSGLDLAVAGSSEKSEDDESSLPMVGNAPGSKHGNN